MTPVVRDYSAWIDDARRLGISEARITSMIEEWMREDLELIKGLCPQCAAPIRKLVDESIRGAPNASTTARFIMYRCSRDAPPGVYDPNRPCGYAMDRWEEFE